MKRLLLIDDDRNLSMLLRTQLRRQGFDVTVANRGGDGLEKFRNGNFDIVISDINMPDMTGIEVLQQIRRVDKEIIIIMMTSYATVDNALDACRQGADDYITKLFGQEHLLFVVQKAIRLRQLQHENQQLRTELKERYKFDGLIARSSAMEKVMRMVGQVASSNATVLVLGESGTGKELIARAIHYNSPRRDKPLVTINCPSIPHNLLESELFGHVKGTFTGAINDRKGKFELADGGTIFLDEIGDLAEGLQAKLLRVLQEHEFERLGDVKSTRVDVRVIAATNKNLTKQMQAGRFREDLYYRLSVVPIMLPPLRERKSEIPYLIDHFVQKYASGRMFTIEADAAELLQQYDWPGNVRELENAIERAVVLSPDDRISLDTIPGHLLRRAGDSGNIIPIPRVDSSLQSIEKRAIQDALAKTGGNKSRAAKLLDIPRHVLLYRLKKFGIS